MPSSDLVFKVEQGCPAARDGIGCGCTGHCHELIEVVKAADYFKLLGRVEALEEWLRQPTRYFPADDARAEREGLLHERDSR